MHLTKTGNHSLRGSSNKETSLLGLLSARAPPEWDAVGSPPKAPSIFGFPNCPTLNPGFLDSPSDLSPSATRPWAEDPGAVTLEWRESQAWLWHCGRSAQSHTAGQVARTISSDTEPRAGCSEDEAESSATLPAQVAALSLSPPYQSVLCCPNKTPKLKNI